MTLDNDIAEPEHSNLSFVQVFEAGTDKQFTDFWAAKSSDDYGADCDRGRSYAAELNDTIERTGNIPLFGSVVREMIAKGRYSGIEAGFTFYFGARVLGQTISIS